jgi:hypothetical protein
MSVRTVQVVTGGSSPIQVIGGQFSMEQTGKGAIPVATPDRNSEAWRHDCEARAILALPSHAAQRRQLSLVEKARGSDARDQLEQTIHLMQDRQRAVGKEALAQIKSLIGQRGQSRS